MEIHSSLALLSVSFISRSWFFSFCFVFIVNLIFLETFLSSPKNMLSLSLSHQDTREKIPLLKTIKIILTKGKNSPKFKHKIRTAHIACQTTCLPVNTQGSWRYVNTSDGNSFEPHTEGSSSGKSGVPVSAEVLKLYLNVGNGFSLLSQYP